jgi:hypothetical protein
MKIGYSMWGFLGPGVLDTPDGSRSFRRSFLDELIKAGHEIVFLQNNRDLNEAGDDLRNTYTWHLGFPEIDLLLFEWRWPLPGRNTGPCGTAGHTCDLHRQQELLDRYTHEGVPTIVWDQDRQLPAEDPIRRQRNVVVAEYSLAPPHGARSLRCPVPDAALDAADPKQLAARRRTVPLVYVGNQYDRDAAFGDFFAPAAKHIRHRVAGKWPRTQAWPHVNFTGRCSFTDVELIHRNALSTVLLMPDRYARVGHMSSRWFEALVNGCLPLLATNVEAAESFVPPPLLVTDSQQVIERVNLLGAIAGSGEHAQLIEAALSYLEPFRASRQPAVVDRLFRELSQRSRPILEGETN